MVETQVADWLFLKNPKVKMTLVGLGIVLGLYLLTGSWLNNIHTATEAINSNFATLKESCERRVALIPLFIQLLQTNVSDSHDVQVQLDRVYQAAKAPINESVLTDKALMETFVANQMAVTQSLSYLILQANNTPSLAQNRQYLILKMQLLSIEQQIDYSLVLLNQSIIIYNSLLTGFPKEWLNTLFLGSKPMIPFKVNTTADQHDNK